MCLSLSSMLQAWPWLGSDAYSTHQSIGNSVNHLNSVGYWLMFVCLLHTLIICCYQMLHIPATVSINLQFGWIDIIKLTRPMSWRHFVFVNQIFPLLQEENVWTSGYTASLPHPHYTAHPLQKVADGKKSMLSDVWASCSWSNGTSGKPGSEMWTFSRATLTRAPSLFFSTCDLILSIQPLTELWWKRWTALRSGVQDMSSLWKHHAAAHLLFIYLSIYFCEWTGGVTSCTLMSQEIFHLKQHCRNLILLL